MTAEKVIQKCGAQAVFEAACESDHSNNFNPLKIIGLDTKSSNDAAEISFIAFMAMSKDEGLRTHWVSNQRFLTRWRIMELSSEDRFEAIYRRISMTFQQMNAEAESPIVRRCH